MASSKVPSRNLKRSRLGGGQSSLPCYSFLFAFDRVLSAELTYEAFSHLFFSFVGFIG